MLRTIIGGLVVSTAFLLSVACSGEGGDPETTPAANGGATIIPIEVATPTATAAEPAQPPTATLSPACPQPGDTGLSSESSSKSVMVDGIQRTYRLYVPTSYDATEPVPLVLNFHGLGSNALEQELYSGFTGLSEREGFILVSPNGTGFIQEWHVLATWLPGYVDDLRFVDTLIDEMVDSLCIDEERIYAAGISNGGAMASLAGCNLDRIAAVATVAGAPYSQRRCEAGRPLPIIAFHGTYDGIVPFNLGEFLGDYLPLTNVREDMQTWSSHNGCDTTAKSEQIATDIVLEAYANCDAGADVRLYVIDGGGHTWPGAELNLWYLGRTTQSIDASELIWSFFEER